MHNPVGLSQAEAAERLAHDGLNELPSAQPRRLWRIALDVVEEPMLLLLIATGAIYLVLGDLRDALAIQVAVFLVIGITLHQERKTERALDALRTLSSPKASVIRDGTTRRIPGREVVAGDLLVLHEGERVAADAILLTSDGLSADESLLTGESDAVPKPAAAAPLPLEEPGGDHRPFVYSGTLVVSGHGLARVLAIGRATALGRIGQALAHIEIGRTPLQQETARIVRILAAAGLAACATVAVAFGVSRSDWLGGALAGLTLAIAMVPEEFPVILTVFLALGAWRISRNHVLARRMTAIETLGSATVLCVDKTGTLTMNRMSVASIFTGGQHWSVDDEHEVPAPCLPVLTTALMASRSDGFDPMERAFFRLGERLHLPAPDDNHQLVRAYPLAPGRPLVAHVWKQTETLPLSVAVKGAPEAVSALCRLTPEESRRISGAVDAMAENGLRVLAVAACDHAGDRLPDEATGFRFTFIGLVGFADPVRPGVPEAIRECREAGVRVVMITGDYPRTAIHIAGRIGLARHDTALTGSDVRRMDDDELGRRAAETDVFARMIPEQKLRLVAALKRAGEVVAMTGDGVNDAPALKAADIGIAMGERGTDVAREAAALVLLDDDFSSIVHAVRLGRRIYDNIRKATSYVLAIHLPIAGMSLIPLVLGRALILLPVHVIFMELIVDPACSVAFEMEPEEDDVMRRPPRAPAERLFSAGTVLRSVLQGGGALLASGLVWWAAETLHLAEDRVRTIAFATLIGTNLALIFCNRSLTRSLLDTWRAPNPALVWMTGGSLAALLAVTLTPAGRSVFHLARPHVADGAAAIAATLGALAWMEAVKHVSRRRTAAPPERPSSTSASAKP